MNKIVWQLSKQRGRDMHKGIFMEAICQHGIGHHKGLHGCDGCCENCPKEIWKNVTDDSPSEPARKYELRCYGNPECKKCNPPELVKGKEIEELYFFECEDCDSKPGSPVLCTSCLRDRRMVNKINELIDAIKTLQDISNLKE